MFKKILTVCGVLAMIVALFTGTQLAANAASTDFKVGYARVDINPYVVDGDFSSGIMALPLRGSGDVWNRLSTYGLIDDNGDGKVNEEDGLKVTCIAVTDGTGKTVLLITVDLIGGTMLDRVRSGIMSRVEEALKNGEISNVDLSVEGIYYAGTHTHNAPDVTVYNANGKTGTNNNGVDLRVVNENLGTWMDRTVEDIGDAVIAALKDRAPAKLTKDVISAKDTTHEAVAGKVMNSVRHYYNAADNCVAGDNFNTRGSDPKQVTEVNDNMYLLQFDFSAYNATSKEDKLPIVLANWRGHPSLNNSDSYGVYSSRNCMSSDYVNAFRHALEYDCQVGANGKGVYSKTQTCRVAFFNGQGGNVNPRGYEKIGGVSAYKWIDNLSTANKECRGNGYGRTLAAMAQECLETAEGAEAVTVGSIRHVQYTYNMIRRTTGYSQVGYDAGKDYEAKAAVGTVSLPYRYKNSNGETYVIGSRFHASNVISNWDTLLQQPDQALVSMEISAFMLGEDVAFVTVPGEPFDYYFDEEDGSNKWEDLVSDIYGTPFVLGYCNGAEGYFPNSKAYDYNAGSTKWTTGSYESHITKYPQGTGERMIDYFGQMLQTLRNGKSFDREDYCTHCGKTVTWKAYSGKKVLSTGHYYLHDDAYAPQMSFDNNAYVCFDLNGKTIRGDRRVFYTDANQNVTLNLMDSSKGQTGVLMGCGGDFGAISGFSGGTVIVAVGNTVNFYSGTMTAYENGYHALRSAGVLLVRGTFNMYGGTVTGGVIHSHSGSYVKSGVLTEVDYKGSGATVCNYGVFNVYDGVIESGQFKRITGTVTGKDAESYRYTQTVEPSTGTAPCIYNTGTVLLAGNTRVSDIYFTGSSKELLMLGTMDAPYTGSVQLSYKSAVKANAVIGSCTGDLAAARITVGGTDLMAGATDGALVARSFCAAVCDSTGEGKTYTTASEALGSYTYSETARNYLRLLSDSAVPLTVSKNLYLDLNGFDLLGDVTVEPGYTLYVMDSRTDDHTVADGCFGKLTGVHSGNVEPVPAHTVGASVHGDGYIKLSHEDGFSFHNVQMKITKMSLRQSEVGIYYTGSFLGDEAVREQVLDFGIALNAYEAPDSENMINGSSLYSAYGPELWNAAQDCTGTMLTGIMKKENTVAQNRQNGERLIYGRGYIRTTEGYCFGEPTAWSLRALLEIASEQGLLRGDALSKTVAMYVRFEDAMKYWAVPELTE